ncbi:MAG: type III polyketide synthase [Proteobacteria bacterium]|nr:type III polyketide synthase [Pseudomonadota bacterium]
MHIAAVGRALPTHRYEQDELLAAFTAFWTRTHKNPRRVEQLHKAVRVGARHLALPMERYPELDFTEANNAFIEVGTELAAKALSEGLEAAGKKPEDLDALFFATVTGLATPSIDARLVNRLGLRNDIVRVPIFGLGCVAGAAGTARVADYLKAYPDHTAALVCVELCSLTLQQGDLSIPNLIATGLFGDGAAALIATGSTGPKVLASRSRFYPDTERTMGWDIGAEGFKIVLSAGVPKLVHEHLGEDVHAFLAANGLTRKDIDVWVCHPGGPKVIDAYRDALDVTDEDLALTWRCLEQVGNLSSASVLWVLADTLAERDIEPGSYGLLAAMGPGFCAELVLLQW